ncbi:Pentatricopeptide repeat-containing protein [Melia azedarach]|uniref:Pentatricopeptide repeat-containing protein n=1 Tax=Melia azedarach TaxID=155640 RepID=A0ACC1WTM7_MELAZ|nr:Pentatricopeptide repeat-containing protein [Melia azedarach]
MIVNLSWSPLNSGPFVYFLMPSRSFCLRSTQQSYMHLSQKFYESMKACGDLKLVPVARKIHAQLISTGLNSSIFLQNHLSNMYSFCGLIDDACRVFCDIGSRNVFSYNTMINGLASSGRIGEAKKLFDEMSERDSVSWNTMMSGYFCNGKSEDTIKVFASMIRDSASIPNLYSFSCVMKACGRLGYVKLALQLHGLVMKFDSGIDASIEKSIMDMYIKCRVLDYAERVFLRMPNPSLFCWNSMIYGYSNLCAVEKAVNLFQKMPEHNSVSWNTMISIFTQHGFWSETLRMFVEMWNRGFAPNSMTYATVFRACTRVYDLEWGTHLHARAVRMEPSLHVFVGNGLIDMYAKCGHLEYARRVFNSLIEPDAVSWTSLISGVAQFGLEEEALVLFNQMREIPIALDEFTIATVLGVCSGQKFLSVGEQLHAYTIKTGMESYVPVGNALVTMYMKCDNTHKVNYAFQLMPKKCIISWTLMISAFSQAGDVEKAWNCFSKMPERNIITWNSMISTFNQHGFPEDSLKLFNLMLWKGIKPDWVTFATSINACADLAMLNSGMQIAALTKKLGFGSDVSVANSIITMYARCGQVEEARKTFDSITIKNLISWNSMMAGYAQNGQGRKVIEIFDNMLKMKSEPDHISFVSVLSGCSHSRLVTEGKHYFISMIKDHCISPTHEHFACMVDLLGRSGFLEEAKSLIDGMPFKPTVDIWGALLGACRIHCNTKLAELVVRNLFELDVDISGSYTLLANLYSDSGKLDGVAGVRKLMREKGIRKNPGCSWIEVDNTINIFTVDDVNHPQIKEIYRVLEQIREKIENNGDYGEAV